MSVRLEIRPSWKHTCVICGRKWYYPTTAQKDSNGVFNVANHMAGAHNIEVASAAIVWEKDHYPWIRRP